MNEIRSFKTHSIRRIFLGGAVFFAVLFLAVYGSLLRNTIRRFRAEAHREFVLPDVHRGFVPQGLYYDEPSQRFLVSGYIAGGQPSRIYVIRQGKKNSLSEIRLFLEDGSDFRGHAGGICAWGPYVYIAGTDDGLYVFRRNDIFSGKKKGRAVSIGLVPVMAGGESIRASFVTVRDDVLTVGECYIPGLLSTPKSHWFKTPGGDETRALALSYPLDTKAPLGVDTTPVLAFTLPEAVQGICFAQDKVLTSSAGFTSSKIFLHAIPQEPFDTFQGIPLYCLESQNPEREFTCLPLIEGIVCRDGKVYSIYEAASNIYNIGKLFSAEWCYSLSLAE